MPLLWIALLAAGAYFTLGSGVSSGYPDGLTEAQVQLAVKNAIAYNRKYPNPGALQGFAQALQPYNATLAAQLTSQAAQVTAATTKPQVKVTVNVPISQQSKYKVGI